MLTAFSLGPCLSFSYNAVNGEPSCASSFLLQDILRDQWDWDGYVTSDCGAIQDVANPHHFRPTAPEAASVSLKAGTDLDCGGFYGHQLAPAIHNGLLDESDLDKALVRLFSARMKLGMFDPFDQQPYMQYPPDILGHPDHVATALQLAQESIVLLKNEGGFLPLHADSIKKMAALGPHVLSTSAMCGNYHGDLPKVISPLEGMQNRFSGEIKGVKGCDINGNKTSDFAPAMEAAKSADVAILFMGIQGGIEGEGRDREEIGLPGVQEQFIEAIAKVQSKTVLVLINGGSVDVSAAKMNPNVVAIVEAFYPGMRGGQAIADVLFGHYNPSGRLPYTIHKKEFVDQISMADMSMTNATGRTYRCFRGEVVYPFGYGLSYTTFEYETSELVGDRTEDGGPKYRVRVTNTGKMDGDTSVLAYLSLKQDKGNSDYSCPLSQLFAFEKIHLKPGESKELFFSASLSALRCYRTSTKSLGVPTGLYSVRIGDEYHDFLRSPDLESMQA